MDIILRMHRGNGQDRTLDLHPSTITQAISDAIRLEKFGFPRGQELIVDGQTVFDQSTCAAEWARRWDAQALRP